MLTGRADREYPVGPLSVPTFGGLDRRSQTWHPFPQCASSSTAPRRARYGFALTDENALAVTEICRRLDGLPLAIELAAARTRLLDPAALLDRLRTSLDALGVGPADLPERQRTLRATVEWSFGLLEVDELDMIATLSVFVDGWTLDAAMYVSGLTEDRTLDLIDALAGHSLVTVDRARERATVPDGHLRP